jgi:hypothetical protein
LRHIFDQFVGEVPSVARRLPHTPYKTQKNDKLCLLSCDWGRKEA